MKFFAAGFFVQFALLLSSGIAFSGTASNSWNAGRVVSSSVSGQGTDIREQNKTKIRRDIWWNYCISSEGTVYAAVSRLTPARSGLTNDNSVKFRISRNRMYVLRPSGKSIELRILRKDRGDTCH